MKRIFYLAIIIMFSLLIPACQTAGPKAQPSEEYSDSLDLSSQKKKLSDLLAKYKGLNLDFTKTNEEFYFLKSSLWPQKILAAELDRSNNRLIILDQDRVLRLWDLRLNQELWRFELLDFEARNDSIQMQLTPGNRALIISGYKPQWDGYKSRIIDYQSGSELKNLNYSYKTPPVYTFLNEEQFLIYSADKKIKIFDQQNKMENLGYLDVGDHPIIGMSAYKQNNQSITLCLTTEGDLNFYDMETKNLVKTEKINSKALRFFPLGDYYALLSGSELLFYFQDTMLWKEKLAFIPTAIMADKEADHIKLFYYNTDEYRFAEVHSSGMKREFGKKEVETETRSAVHVWKGRNTGTAI